MTGNVTGTRHFLESMVLRERHSVAHKSTQRSRAMPVSCSADMFCSDGMRSVKDSFVGREQLALLPTKYQQLPGIGEAAQGSMNGGFPSNVNGSMHRSPRLARDTCRPDLPESASPRFYDRSNSRFVPAAENLCVASHRLDPCVKRVERHRRSARSAAVIPGSLLIAKLTS